MDSVNIFEHANDKFSISGLLTILESVHTGRCKVCEVGCTRIRYGICICHSCVSFFERSVQSHKKYRCRSNNILECVVKRSVSMRCRSCRLQKCFRVGMHRDVVQQRREPRSKPKSQINISNGISDSGQDAKVHQKTPHFPALLLIPSNEIDSHLRLFIQQQNTLRKLRLPSTAPFITTEDIPATAARHIFFNINSITCGKLFHKVPQSIQFQILEGSCKDLFILSVAQLTTEDNIVSCSLAAEAKLLQHVLNQLHHLKLDMSEYRLLRAIIITRSGCSSSAVNILHKRLKAEFEERVRTIHPNTPHRHNTIMKALTLLINISDHTIEELFFRLDIGVIKIQRTICIMHRIMNDKSSLYHKMI